MRPGAGEARLAHGDFDTTHILQVDGDCSGLIDFGEIRGPSRCSTWGTFSCGSTSAPGVAAA
jgi:hypothetical protein